MAMTEAPPEAVKYLDDDDDDEDDGSAGVTEVPNPRHCSANLGSRVDLNL